MKTPIEEAIKEIRKMTDDKEVTFNFGLTTAIEILNNKLPKEREQIERAFNEGYREAEIDCNRVSTTDISEWGNANIYYETTFKK